MFSTNCLAVDISLVPLFTTNQEHVLGKRCRSSRDQSWHYNSCADLDGGGGGGQGFRTPLKMTKI